jgi:hypothetical protein
LPDYSIIRRSCPFPHYRVIPAKNPVRAFHAAHLDRRWHASRDAGGAGIIRSCGAGGLIRRSVIAQMAVRLAICSASTRTARPLSSKSCRGRRRGSQFRTRLSAGGKWIRTSGSARDCTTVEVGSRASPAQSSSPAARPRLERAANGGSLGSAPEEIPRPHPSVPTASLRSDVFGLGASLPTCRPAPTPAEKPGAAAVFLPATSSAISGKPNGAIPRRHALPASL